MFVGKHNTGVSQMAEAIFNHLARERHVDYEAVSAGTSPGFALSLIVEDVMAEIRLPLTGKYPRPITAAAVAQAYRIICLNEGAISGLEAIAGGRPFEIWPFPELRGLLMEAVRDIRNEIRWKIEDLIQVLPEPEAVETPTVPPPADAVSPSSAIDPPLRCNLHAFTDEQDKRYRLLRAALQKRMLDRTEMSDGFAYTFPSDDAACIQVMEFATLERRCCPFFTMRIDLPAESGPLTLTITGPDGTKEILKEWVP